ncbi:hypothetical protein CR513_40222, partial [Mucuna pruriens]
MGHFGVQKTLEILQEHFFWPHMKRNVHKFCDHCLVCKKAKSKVKPHGLYTPLPIPTSPWINISMDFGFDPPRSRGERDPSLLWWIDNACHMTNVFFKEVVRLHGVPRIIVLDKDTKFLMINATTSHSPFQLIYGFNLLSLLDMLPFPNIKSMTKP